MRKLLGLVSVCVLVLAGCSSEAVGSLDDNMLTVGMECDYAPYNFTTNEANKSEYAYDLGNGSYCDGYDVWMSNQLADSLGVDLTIQKVAWDGLIPALNSGQIDAIIGGMSPTEERKQTIAFSEAYFENEADIVLVVNADSPYADATSLEDLKEMKISTQMGTFHSELLTQITDANIVDPMADFNTLLQATSSGVLDGYVSERPVALAQTANNKDVVMVEFEESQGFVLDESQTTSAIGIRKDDSQLVESLNSALMTIDSTTRTEMMDYFNSRGE